MVPRQRRRAGRTNGLRLHGIGIGADKLLHGCHWYELETSQVADVSSGNSVRLVESLNAYDERTKDHQFIFGADAVVSF